MALMAVYESNLHEDGQGGLKSLWNIIIKKLTIN
jgi:hypothetical protein